MGKTPAANPVFFELYHNVPIPATMHAKNTYPGIAGSGSV